MQSLYRAYRPQTFAEVIGQDHVVSALQGAIAAKRVSHAYLFAGSRGIGKTSIARIFARDLGVSANDTYEIDAASNRGIDDIRELRDGVAVLPFESPYKVYILDEVHMLSKDAWNALLKTLEEPPAHVIFILATTEIEKVPETVISRCQVFAFKKPAREVIAKQVIKVGAAEGYTVDPGAAELIALLGDGAFRDALGMLEKAIGAARPATVAASSKKGSAITREAVEKLTGTPQAALVNSLAEHIISKNADVALAIVAKAEESGVPMGTLALLLLEKLRFILLVQHSPSIEATIATRVSPDDAQFIKTQAARKALTVHVISAFLDAADHVGRSTIAAVPLELAIVEICAK